LLPLTATGLVILGTAFLFSGCHTLKQGAALPGYPDRTIPLEVLEEGEDGKNTGDRTEAELNRRFAERIRNVRSFAIREPGLRNTKNYTRYAAIDREYPAAAVSASAADSFVRHEWCFPVAGQVPCKGFFNDVWIHGVDAFSTLGWFRDPLYSCMRNYPVHLLRNTA
jgi:predicted aminopeptidase